MPPVGGNDNLAMQPAGGTGGMVLLLLPANVLRFFCVLVSVFSILHFYTLKQVKISKIEKKCPKITF